MANAMTVANAANGSAKTVWLNRIRPSQSLHRPTEIFASLNGLPGLNGLLGIVGDSFGLNVFQVGNQLLGSGAIFQRAVNDSANRTRRIDHEIVERHPLGTVVAR